ncbi:MAG: alanine racemase [Anaerotignum sp.]|nr:alanine racemase [Anaerotignum sp.]
MNFKIEPHKKGDAGMLCMPLVSNLPDADKKHQDWKKTTCPACGAECWVSDAHQEILKSEPKVKAVCTMCALKGIRL